MELINFLELILKLVVVLIFASPFLILVFFVIGITVEGINVDKNFPPTYLHSKPPYPWNSEEAINEQDQVDYFQQGKMDGSETRPNRHGRYRELEEVRRWEGYDDGR
jgi:hypothetical protein